MCLPACTDSVFHNADADTDGEGSDDEWLTGKTTGHPCTFSARCFGVCSVGGRFGEKPKPLQFLS